MTSVLVVGGGYIGLSLAEELSKKFEVTLAVHEGKTALKNSSYKVIPVDITNLNSIKKVVQHQDYIINASGKIFNKIDDQADGFDINVLGQVNLLEAVSQVNKDTVIIYFASRDQYGFTEEKNIPIAEDFPFGFGNIYGNQKMLGEMVCNFYRKNFGVNSIILRLSGVYGPSKLNSQRNVVNKFIIQSLAGKPMTLHGEGKRIKDYLYLPDISRVIKKLIKKNIKNKVFNIGCGKGTSLYEITEIIKKNISGAQVLNINFPEGFKDLGPYIADVSKLIKTIDFKPTNIEEGIKRTIDNFLGGE